MKWCAQQPAPVLKTGFGQRNNKGDLQIEVVLCVNKPVERTYHAVGLFPKRMSNLPEPERQFM